MGILSTESSESSSSGLEAKSSEGESSLSELLSDTEPASEPGVPKPKPKTCHGHPRKPCIIIWRGTCTTWRQCTLCSKQFARQIESNCHTVEDHD